MTSLPALITALIRLLGLFLAVRALDKAAAPMLFHLQVSALPGYQLSNPWAVVLPTLGFYFVLAVAIFLAAPRLAKLMIEKDNGGEGQLPWHETLIFCTGSLIASWAFVRLTDTLYHLMAAGTSNSRRQSLDNATMVYLFLTMVLLCGGLLLIAKFHRISQWMARRRTAANKSVED